MAQLLRMGRFRPVYAKSAGSQEVRALWLPARSSSIDSPTSSTASAAILRNFGLNVDKVAKTAFDTRIRERVTGHAMLEQIAGSMLPAGYFAHSVRKVLQDEVCRRFMTMPSVGAIVAIPYRSALADPRRIKKSKNAGRSSDRRPGGTNREVTRFSALKRWGGGGQAPG
jgi:hypothetical protein